MLISLDPNKPLRYVFKSDRELVPSEQAALLIRPMKLREFFDLMGKFNLNDLKEFSTANISEDQIYGILEEFVVGWENVVHPETKLPIHFSFNGNGKADRFNWNYLPIRYQFEALEAILKSNQIAGAEEKN